MTPQRLRFLFDRYVNQTISEVEKSEFFNAIAQADNDPQLKQLVDELWFSIPNDNHPEIPPEVFQGIARRTKLGQFNPTARQWLKFAASISLVVVAGFAFYFAENSAGETTIESKESLAVKPRNSFVRLPDGSTVVLNAGSALHYPTSFKDEPNRVVKLEGEGFFDIQHDAAHPFIVISGSVKTTVLGTAFNIKAYPADGEVTVTVSRGKVEVSSDRKPVAVLTKNQQVKIKNGVTNKGHIVDAQDATAWMETDITFDDVTLIEALEELEDRFNVTIRLMNDQAYDCRFTGTFVRGESIEQILLVVCEFNGVTMSRNSENGVIEINGPGCDR